MVKVAEALTKVARAIEFSAAIRFAADKYCGMEYGQYAKLAAEIVKKV